MLNKFKTLDKRKIFTVSATFFVAWATGFAMQNSDLIAEQLGVTQVSPVHAVELASADLTTKNDTTSAHQFTMPRPPRAALHPVSGQIDKAAIRERVRRSAIRKTPAVEFQQFSPFGLACSATFTVKPAPAAMVNVTLNAPCHGREAVEISHNGLAFTVRTTTFGAASVTVPAMAKDAEFEVRFNNGETLWAATSVPEFTIYDRVAVQWQGKSNLKIHALEFGARYADAGHVWAKAPRTISYGVQARGGFIVDLGNANLPDAKQAEVYSFPTGSINRAGTVRLSVEAEVSAYSCGHDVDAQVLQKDATGTIKTVDLTLIMPDCGAIGDHMVLKNVLQDLKIAQN